MSTPEPKTLRQKLKQQKETLMVMDQNTKVLIVMIEALRAKFGLSPEDVEGITNTFIEEKGPEIAANLGIKVEVENMPEDGLGLN